MQTKEGQIWKLNEKKKKKKKAKADTFSYKNKNKKKFTTYVVCQRKKLI